MEDLVPSRSPLERHPVTQPAKATIEQIVSAYRNTGSVWKAALELGMAGQSVHERLVAIDYPMNGRKWKADELDELRRLAGSLPVAEIAQRLGRPYAAIACKLSEIGVSGRQLRRKAPRRGSGYDRESTRRHRRELASFQGSLRQFCIARGLSIDGIVYAFERYEDEWWQQWRRDHSELEDRRCNYCERVFTPMTKKQTYCSRKCSADKTRDDTYFNGNRRNTIGLAEGVCQLCGRKDVKGLSSHHILGKEHDPEGRALIALCPGCHQIVGRLSSRVFLRETAGWEALISLVYFRAMGDARTHGVHVYVDIEPLTEEDFAEDQAPTLPVTA